MDRHGLMASRWRGEGMASRWRGDEASLWRGGVWWGRQRSI